MKRSTLLVSVWLLSATSMLLASPPSPHPAPNGSGMDALRKGFVSPPQEARLRCYWWWLKGNTTAETITHDLEEMKSHGYAGALLVDADGSGQQGNEEVRTGPAIGSPEWLALFTHALKVAQDLGLEISLNVTSRWEVGIIGGSTVTPADAMKLLTWSRTTVESGGVQTVKLSPPPVDSGFYRSIATLAYPLHHGAALAGATGSERNAIRDLRTKSASAEAGISMSPAKQSLRNAPPVAGEQDTDLNQVIDVSAHVDSDGVLHWSFPSGTWEVLRIGYTVTGKHLVDSTEQQTGLPLDTMSAHAFDDYWGQSVMPLLDAAKPYIGTSLRYLVTDSWEAGGTNWTDSFREEFKRRRGYDPVSYLPIVAGRILDSRETSNRFLFDLRRTVADLIAENYYDRFADHARKSGLGVHPEAGGPHGAPIDALENFRSVSFPQTEFWVASNTHRVTDGDRFFVKEASSAAHIYGKQYVAAEGLTSMALAAWSESPGRNLQPTFDHALTEGLNRLFWHEFTSSPAEYGLPGEEYFAGTHLNPNVTWWKQSVPLLTAFNRAQFLLQQGRPVSDLLYFYGDQVPGMVRVKSDDPAHVLPGYDYDVVNEDALLHHLQFSAADLHTPEGVHYRALALPDSPSLSLAALRWIEHFVAQGGVVIGTKVLGTTGLIPPQDQAEYTRIANALWKGCESASGSTALPYGQGRIVCTEESRAALGAIGVAPDFDYKLSGDAIAGHTAPAFDYVHRQTEDADIYFVRNTQDATMQATLSFRVHGRVPELWAADEGTITPVLVYRETSDGRTEIPLTFPRTGSTFILFRHASERTQHLTSIRGDGKDIYPSIRQGVGVFASGDDSFAGLAPGSYEMTDENQHSRSMVVHGDTSQAISLRDWTLSFPPGWGAPPSVPVQNFESWTQSAIPDIRYFSGTATYRATLHLPDRRIKTGHELWLNLGSVREIAAVKVNGIPIETLWREPFVVRVDPQLHAGDNTVEIEVTNLWTNRLIGDLQPAATGHYTHTNVHAYTRDSPLLSSGLLDPVAVQITSEQPLR